MEPKQYFFLEENLSERKILENIWCESILKYKKAEI